MRKRSLLFISIVGMVIIGANIVVTNHISMMNTLKNVRDGNLLPHITTTSMPFRELTIPYLRSRTYKSSLIKKTLLQETDSYRSYIAEYQSDGLRIYGLLTIPIGEQPKNGWPAIVFIHGYIPPSTYETNGHAYATYVDYLARNGFVVFKIDLRGHGTSEGRAGGGYYGSDYVVDTLNAYAVLSSTDFVNAKKIGLWGHSMAGNIVLRTLAVKPETPVAVIWAGAGYTYTDLVTYGIQDKSYQPLANNAQRFNQRRLLFDTYGSPSASSKFWYEVAPTSYLKDLKGAIQIHHAIDDDVVNIGYSRDLVTLLDKTKIPHEFYEYETGGHNVSGDSFSVAMDRTVEFFKKYLD